MDNHPSNTEDDYPWVSCKPEDLFPELELLFMSRVRAPYIEDIPLINSSVLNYGINDTFTTVNEPELRSELLEQRILNVVARFEPRLTQVSIISNMSDPSFILFTINACYQNSIFALELKWSNCTGRFYFNE
jgi:type VI secretion system protein ImpF